jgi:hypothetical protein
MPALAGLANGQTGQALETVGGDLMRNGIKDRIRFAAFEVAYDDDNFAERYFNYRKTRERWTQGREPPPENPAAENQSIQDLVDKLVELGFPKGPTIEFVETAFAFAKEPDEFEFVAEFGDRPEQAATTVRKTTLENYSASLDPEQIKADLIGQTMEGPKGMFGSGWWKFGSLSEFQEVTINDKKQAGGLIEYDVNMRLKDINSANEYLVEALITYKKVDGVWKIASVSKKSFEQAR